MRACSFKFCVEVLSKLFLLEDVSIALRGLEGYVRPLPFVLRFLRCDPGHLTSFMCLMWESSLPQTGQIHDYVNRARPVWAVLIHWELSKQDQCINWMSKARPVCAEMVWSGTVLVITSQEKSIRELAPGFRVLGSWCESCLFLILVVLKLEPQRYY